MQPIQRRSLVDTVVDSLQSEITSGTWEVGSRIPTEAELVSQLGVSRPSVREGVRALVQLGLLETRQGDGTYVVADDPTAVALRRTIRIADTREVMRVRRALDALAAREAAEHRTPDDLAQLETALLARRVAARRGDAAAFVDRDVAFHLGVVAASHNQLLAGIYASFDNSLHSAVTSNAPGSMSIESTSADRHEALFFAIRDRDGDAAQAAALAVVERSEELMED
ncbi:FadR/GntR family transcriptional regulator [Microbacterium candidum]|uniref:FadR/GntR family transcriptional regulator n=1 Tax=Microbacterium candidum TaxID=3041922 RepID=A0ABT7N4A9_9MICO|nr:FadR/GntR family transcriptional regulator [Microbacterium sp. ASV49]MDL9981535.1 FadR/GntR family transcriptional regulator [Microbacterium sp. ASV49]